MADGRVLLEVIVEGKNTRIVQRDVESVTDAVNENTAAQRRNKKATDETSTSHAHYDRGLKGVHQSNLSASKGFSKMRDAMTGSSGLVGAYATLAANLFAATAAFAALQKAAQVEQLTKGLSALGASSGLAMMSLSKGLQESTGFAITLQDAMRSVAMVTSAGFNPDVIERLGAVATNTSIALGRDVQDSMNRLVKGATKLEPELLDELGIMVRLDEASQKYARSMGKSASELTNFEKRQAFMNAILEEGEKKFGAIGDSVEVNPYDRLSATIQSLSTSVLNFANILLGPLAKALSASEASLFAVVLILSKGIINQALPYFSQLAQEASKAAEMYSASWSIESKKAAESVKEARDKIAAADTKGLSKKQAITFSGISTGTASQSESKALEASIRDRIDKLEKRKQAGWESEKIANQKLSQQTIARYEREMILLKEKLALVATLNAAEMQAASTASASAVSKEAEKFAKTIEEASNSFDAAGGIEAIAAFGAGLKSVTIGALDYVKGMFAASAANTRFGTFLSILSRTMKVTGAVATATGRVISFAFKGLLSAIPYIGMVILAFDLLKMAWNKIVDAFKSDATLELEKKLEKASSAFEELATNSEEVNKSLVGTSNTIKTFAQRTEAQMNIVSQLYSQFKELSNAQQMAGQVGEEFLKKIDEQIQKNILLKNAFASEFEGLSSTKEVRDKNNKSIEETIVLVGNFLKVQNALNVSQQGLNKAIFESNTTFRDYSNSFVKSDVVTKYATALEQVELASRSTENGTADLARAASQLEDEQLKFLKLSPKQVSNLVAQADQLDKYNALQNRATEALAKYNAIDMKSGSSASLAKITEEINQVAELVNSIRKDTGRDPIELTGDLDKDKVTIMRDLSFFAGDGAENMGWFAKLSKMVSSEVEEFRKKIQEVIPPQLKVLKDQLALGNAFELSSKKLQNLEEKYARFGVLSKAQTQELIAIRKTAAEEEIKYLDSQINTQQALIDAKRDESGNIIEGVELDSRRQTLNLLKEEKARKQEIFKEQFSDLGRLKQERIIELKTIESVTSELSAQLDIQNKLISSAKEIASSRAKIRETEAKLADLRAGGTGELTAQKQYQLQLESNRERKILIEQERSAKIEALRLEKELLERKFELSIIELALIKKREGFSELPPGLRQLVDRQYDLYFDTNGQLRQQERNIGDQIYASGVEAANLSARAELLSDEEKLEQEKRRAEEESRQQSLKIVQAQLEAANVTSSIESKIFSSRSSILDSDRTIRENELKAANLRNKGIGEYKLTTEQLLQLEVEFGNKRMALLKEEEAMKLKIIDLEFKLAKIQLTIQQKTLESTILGLKRTATGQDLINLQELERDLPGIFAEAANLLPEAQAAATQELLIGTKAAVSSIEASQIEAIQNVMGWTDKMTTSWKEVSTAIGQNFISTLEEAKSITQELADAFTNSIYAAVDAFVDAIVEGKNAFKAIGEALRTSLQESFAEAAKAKLKEGIAGIGSTIFSKIGGMFPGGKGLGEDVIKLMQGPQERAALAAENTNAGIIETNKLLTQIAQNTANCCSSGMSGTSTTALENLASRNSAIEASSANANMSMTKPKVILDPVNDPFGNYANQDMSKLNKKTLQVSGLNYQVSKDIDLNTGNTVKEVGFWGSASEYATNNVGTIAAAGFASIVTAIAAGRSTKSSILGGILGIAGTVVGGMFGGGPAGAAFGGQVGAMIGARADFAKGGVMSSSGPMPLQKYARGGVARTPQLAMFGEGSKPEAYVPLPDGRTIPVTMSNGGGNVNNISVNVAVEGGQAQAQTTGGADNTEEYSRRLGTAISNAVKQEIFNQQRPGGLLYKGRR